MVGLLRTSTFALGIVLVCLSNAQATDYASSIVGTNPPRYLFGGDTVTVTGNLNPAIISNGTPRSVIVSGGGVTLTNMNATGIGVATTQAGGFIDLGDGTVINTEGYNSAANIIGATGVYARDAGSTITARNLNVSAKGDNAYGVYTRINSRIDLYGTTVINLANSSGGNNGGITYGLVANSGGVLNAENVNIAVIGIGATFGRPYAVSAWGGGSASVSGTTVVDLEGDRGGGVVYSSGSGSLVTIGNVQGTLHTRTGDAYGLAGVTSGEVRAQGLVDLAISSDTEVDAIMVHRAGKVSITGASAKLTASAPIAYGIVAYDAGSQVTAQDIDIRVVGSTVAAAIYNSSSVAGSSSISLTRGSLDSNRDGVVVNGGTLNLSMTDTVLVNRSGVAFRIDDATIPSVLDLTADSSTFSGAALTGASSRFDLRLGNSSVWDVTGDSNLTNLVNDNSQIRLVSGGTYRTLTTGSYVGNAGRIDFNTFLGNDSSPSDRLVIDGGSATGTTQLFVTNAGGGGALTVGDGILLVQAENGATTANAFALGNRVAAGAYDYLLFYGGESSSGGDPNDQNWYLRSTLRPEPSPTPVPAVRPNIRPEVAVMSALMPIATEYGFAMLDTLHERTGNNLSLMPASVVEERNVRCSVRQVDSRCTAITSIPVVADEQTSVFSGAWARVLGNRGFRESKSFERHGPGYDYTFGGIQAGLDAFGRETSSGDTDKAGIYVGYGRINSNVQRVYGGHAGSIDMNAYTVGGYWTHNAHQGWYTDAVVLGTWYSTDTRSVYGERLQPDGFGAVASIEGGFAFSLSNGLTLEPQIQLAYQSLSFDRTRDAFGRFSFDDGDSLRGRVGARLTRTWDLGEAKSPRLMTMWIRANVWHEFNDEFKTTVTSLAGTNPYLATSSLGGTWGEIGVGISGQLTDAVTMFGTAIMLDRASFIVTTLLI